MAAHHSSNGCNLQAGDLFGSPRLSGSDCARLGSLLALRRNGRKPIVLKTGEACRCLEGGDEIVFRAHPGLGVSPSAARMAASRRCGHVRDASAIVFG